MDPIWFHAISGTEEHCETLAGRVAEEGDRWKREGEVYEGKEELARDEGDKGALSRTISTAHCPMPVAHNSDPVQLGSFPSGQDYPLRAPHTARICCPIRRQIFRSLSKFLRASKSLFVRSVMEEDGSLFCSYSLFVEVTWIVSRQSCIISVSTNYTIFILYIRNIVLHTGVKIYCSKNNQTLTIIKFSLWGYLKGKERIAFEQLKKKFRTDIREITQETCESYIKNKHTHSYWY